MQVSGRPVVELPEKRVHIVKVAMQRKQRSKYEAWAAATRPFVLAHLEANTLLRHYSSILEGLLRCAPAHRCADACCRVGPLPCTSGRTSSAAFEV